jgi:hypothetical protein
MGVSYPLSIKDSRGLRANKNLERIQVDGILLFQYNKAGRFRLLASMKIVKIE